MDRYEVEGHEIQSNWKPACSAGYGSRFGAYDEPKVASWNAFRIRSDWSFTGLVSRSFAQG